VKLATRRDGTRDGALLVVSRDLRRAAPAGAIAPTLQAALDGWTALAPPLEVLAAALEAGRADAAFDLDPATLAAPLPRASGFIDSSVYLNHMELARRLRGATVPEAYRREPLMSLRLSAPFLAAHDDLELPAGDVGLDIEGEVAAIVDDVEAGTPPGRAGARIRLLTLVNDVSLRTVFAREVAEGKTTYHGKVGATLAPVAVTPDELGAAWTGGAIALPLVCRINGALLGRPDAATDMAFDFPRIVAEACARRPLPAGTVIAAGTVSNRDRAAGSACIAERRMIETLEHGAARTPWLAAGDEIRIEMLDAAGRSVFGAIAQRVVAAHPA
jgi:fumarylacetoacetate (FAA) hydrolase